jgi:hypothetical protein
LSSKEMYSLLTRAGPNADSKNPSMNLTPKTAGMDNENVRPRTSYAVRLAIYQSRPSYNSPTRHADCQELGDGEKSNSLICLGTMLATAFRNLDGSLTKGSPTMIPQ